MVLVNNVNKAKNVLMFCLSVLMLLSVINSVSAAVDVTYYFDKPNVNVVAFNCLDQNCNSVGQFSGQIIDGPSVSDGSVVLRYPDSKATPYGYAEFFTADGFRPLVGKHDWHTFGVSGIATASQSANFSKIQGVCNAVASVQDIAPVIAGSPVSVNAVVALNQQTADAFRQSSSTGVNFIPSELLQSFWGADTVVGLTVLDSNSAIVYSEDKVLSAVNNNALFSSSSVPLSFGFTPMNSGNFIARITSKVVDNQCASSLDSVIETNFVISINNNNNNQNNNQTNNNQTNSTIPLTLSMSLSPLNGVLNQSFVVLNANSDSSAVCRWSLQNVDFNSMTNLFNSSDSLSHEARVSGFVLGDNSVFASCSNSVAFANASASFFVENILDGSSLVNSTAVNSSIINSVLNNSSVINSSITGSTISNAQVNNAVIVNNVISSGEITINGLLYNASLQGSVLISRLVPSVPVANFVPLSKTVELQGFVSFGSTSTDVDVGGPLNDSLSFFWNFGDGTNSTASSFNKIYSRAGDYVVSLKVTDKFNLSSTKYGSVKVLDYWLTDNDVSSSSKKRSRSSASDDVSEVIVAPIMKSSNNNQNDNSNNNGAFENQDESLIQETVINQLPPVEQFVFVKNSGQEISLVVLLVIFNTALFSGIIYAALKLFSFV